MLRRGISLFVLWAGLAFGVLSALPSAASELKSLSIHVRLEADGGARIVQTWEVDVFGKGTEFFIEQTRLGDMALSDFSVRESKGTPYHNEGRRWRSDRTAAEKAGRCGILPTNKGLELCWGRGAEGLRTYVVSWRFSNFVKAYDDYDGFNVQLVNSGMSPPPRRLEIVIERLGRPFAAGEVAMWAFGLRGTILPEGGRIVVRSDGPLTASDYATVMLRFAKGIFAPSSVVRGRFQTVEDRALAGVEGREDDWSDLYDLLSPLLFFGVISLFSFVAQRARRAQSPLVPKLSPRLARALRDVPYVREIPCGGVLSEPWFLLSATPFAVGQKELVGAYFLRWVRNGALEAVSFSSGTELCVRAREVSEGAGLFAMLREAAGSDGILQGSEFARWGQVGAHQKAFDAWLASERAEGRRRFEARGGLEMRTTTSFWVRRFFLGPRRPFSAPFATPDGERMILEVTGFRRYLRDFTLVNERHVVEVALWDDYLVFAALFGIGRELERELLSLYPEFASRSALVGGKGGTGGKVSPTTILSLSDSFASSLSRRSSGKGYDSSSGGGSFRSGGGGSSGGGSRGGER